MSGEVTAAAEYLHSPSLDDLTPRRRAQPRRRQPACDRLHREVVALGVELDLVRQGDGEPGVKVATDGRCRPGDHLAAVPAYLVPPAREQLGGRQPVVAEQPVHRVRRPVALLPRVDHEHRPA